MKRELVNQVCLLDFLEAREDSPAAAEGWRLAAEVRGTTAGRVIFDSIIRPHALVLRLLF